VRLWLRADANLRQAVPATAAVPEVLNLRPTRPRRQPLGNGPLSPLHGRPSPRGFAPGMWNVPSLRESQPAFPKGWKPCHQSRSAQRPRWEIRSPRRGRSRLLWAKPEARGTIYAVMSSLGIEVPPVQPARSNRGENRTNSQRCVRSSGSPSGSGRTSSSRRITAHATGKGIEVSSATRNRCRPSKPERGDGWNRPHTRRGVPDTANGARHPGR
jgi:hypothetical protein